MTAEPTRLLTRSPAVLVPGIGYTLAWPLMGVPSALDPASAAILECFADAATIDEVAEDLADAAGINPEDAARTVRVLADHFVQTGHLALADGTQLPHLTWSYPPSASP